MNGYLSKPYTYSKGLLWPALLLLFLMVWSRMAAAQQVQSGITQPAPGDVVSGVVIIEGTAAHDAFLRYELAFRRDNGGWIVFAEGDRPVVESTLAIWDTTVGYPQSPVFPDGVYQLRLRVVRQDYNYDEYFLRDLTLANEDGTPTPTATTALTATVSAGDASPAGTATPQPGSGIGVGRPTLLPSLTPFPTPSPQATVANVASGDARPGATGGGEEPAGLLGRLATIDLGRFREAFWQGVTYAFYPFAALALYLLLRALLRWLWRLFWSRSGGWPLDR